MTNEYTGKPNFPTPYYLTPVRETWDIAASQVSHHRYGHRYYISFMDDEYLHHPKKVTFLHLYFTYNAAKLELTFHHWEKYFEIPIYFVFFCSIPILCTHIIPGLVIYSWVFIGFLCLITLILIGIWVMWYTFGCGMNWDFTSTRKRSVVKFFLVPVLLRLFVVLLCQTAINYMTLFYDKYTVKDSYWNDYVFNNTNNTAWIHNTTTSTSTSNYSVISHYYHPNYLYLHNIMYEFDTRIQFMGDCGDDIWKSNNHNWDVNYVYTVFVWFNWI